MKRNLLPLDGGNLKSVGIRCGPVYEQSSSGRLLWKRWISLGAVTMTALSVSCELTRQEPSAEKAQPMVSKPPPKPGPLGVPNSNLPPKVDEVLKLKCRRCHTTPMAHGAPFALLTYEDTQKPRFDIPIWRFIGTTVKSGFMPYKIPLDPPVEPLTAEEKYTILNWVAYGAPDGASGWEPVYGPPPPVAAKTQAAGGASSADL